VPVAALPPPAVPFPVAWRRSLRQLVQEPLLAGCVLLLWLWLLALVVYPLVQVFLPALFHEGQFGGAAFRRIFALPYYRNVLANTLVLAGAVACLGTLMGFAYAFVVIRVAIPRPGLFHLLALLPTISPPFIFGLSIIMLLGRRGLVTHGLLGLTTGALYGLPGLVIAQLLGFFPFAYLLLRNLLLGLDPALEEAAVTLGAGRWQVFRTVTLPILTAGIASAFLLLFIYSLTDLGNPLVIGGDYTVMASQIYLAVIGQYNLPLGTALAVLLLVPSTLLFLAQKGLERRSTFATITGRPSGPAPRLADGWAVFLGVAFCSLVVMAILAVYLTMLGGAVTRLWGVDYQPTLKHFQAIFGTFSLGFKTLRDTILLASVASVLAGGVGVVLGYLVVRTRFPGRTAMDFLATLPMAVPGIVIGIGFAIAFNRPPLLLSGTAAIIVLIFAVRTMPYGLRSAVAAVGQIERSIDEASFVSGATRAQTFRRVVFPLVRRAFVAGLIYNFTRNITSLSAVIFVVSPRWNLVTAAMLAEVDAGRISGAAAFGVFLVVLVLVLNALMFRYGEGDGLAGRSGD
jgi:iron(III) transport system permease protein